MRRTTSGLRGADDASDSSGDGGYVDGRRSFFKKKTATADPLRSVEEGYYRAPDGGRARSKSPKARSRQPTIAFSSVGGGTVVSTLDDTLGCRCSFHLPSNVQIFRMFACMIVGILLVKVSFAPGDRGFTRRGNRHSGIRNFDLRQLYEKSDLASTQANFGTVRLGDVRLGGDAARGGARDARRGGNGAEYGTSTDGDDAAFGAAPTPLKISRIVHQTYKSKDVPERMKPFMETWRAMNPGWEMRFYDDEGCTEFVKREFPEYYDAYAGLPKHVERSDFFRYLVVLREGGVYADIDTSCEKPLDSFINANDTLVVGWENEFDTDEMAYSRHFVRRRQVLNWAFAGAAGHPALRETCDHVNENYQRDLHEQHEPRHARAHGPGRVHGLRHEELLAAQPGEPGRRGVGRGDGPLGVPRTRDRGVRPAGRLEVAVERARLVQGRVRDAPDRGGRRVAGRPGRSHRASLPRVVEIETRMDRA